MATAPIDTGTLQDSHVIQDIDTASGQLALRLVTANVEYAASVHVNRPWLANALEQSPTFAAVLDQHLQATLGVN